VYCSCPHTVVCRHESIENSPRSVVDIIFGDDACRERQTELTWLLPGELLVLLQTSALTLMTLMLTGVVRGANPIAGDYALLIDTALKAGVRERV